MRVPALDDDRPSPAEGEPPELMVVLRREIAALCADRNDVTVEHDFTAEGVYRAGDGPGPAVEGWGTTLAAVRRGT